MTTENGNEKLKTTLKYFLANKVAKRNRKKIILWDENPVSEKKTSYKVIRYLKINEIKVIKSKDYPNKKNI
jgi:hypothetical protein